MTGFVSFAKLSLIFNILAKVYFWSVGNVFDRVLQKKLQIKNPLFTGFFI